MQEQSPDRRTMVHENESLKQKILQIEMQNVAQQRRLQQLEKMVMELSRMKSPKDVLDTPHMTPFREPTENGSKTERAQEGRLEDASAGARGKEGAGGGREEDDHADGGMSDIVANLMDEFDRTARENGLIYGMTPTRSTADSEDQGDIYMYLHFIRIFTFFFYIFILPIQICIPNQSEKNAKTELQVNL